MTMDDQSKKVRQVRLQISLSEATLEAINDYRFANRTPSRSEAVRQLLRIGQTAEPPRRRSR